nr:EOG090X0438 [Triops cancriformis]
MTWSATYVQETVSTFVARQGGWSIKLSVKLIFSFVKSNYALVPFMIDNVLDRIVCWDGSSQWERASKSKPGFDVSSGLRPVEKDSHLRFNFVVGDSASCTCLKMKRFIALLLGILAVVSADNVVDLVDDDFDSKIAAYDTALVMFYAPWCGHCKKLKPEFEKASTDLKNNDPPIILAKVDCTEGGKSVCSRFSVQGYPTLKIFRGGEVSAEYNGPRDANGIVKYMRAQVGPAAKDLTSVDAHENFLKVEEVGVVGYFGADSSLKTAFLKLADKLRETTRFGIATEKSVLDKVGETDAIILYRPKHLQNKFEPSSVKYSGAANKEDINSWLEKSYHGLVGHRSMDNVGQFRDPVVIAFYNVDYKKNVKGTNYWRNRILKVAQSFKDDFTFAVSNKDDFTRELGEFGVDYISGDKPRIVARNAKGKKFVMTEEFSPEAFEKFLNDLKADTLEPYIKSEPIPANDTPLKVAVAKNFDDVVVNNGKDTLIEFYAPWCGHCKKLAPVFDELANKLKDEDVAIVKMDATANDVPSGFDVRGFPTLFWLPKDSKDTPKSYDGGRDVNDFVKYIAKHATNELKSFDRSGNPKTKTEEL